MFTKGFLFPLMALGGLAGMVFAAATKKKAAAETQPVLTPTATPTVVPTSIPTMTLPSIATPPTLDASQLQVLQNQIAQVLQSGNSTAMRALAAQLQTAGFPEQAQQLLRYAEDIEAAERIRTTMATTIPTAQAPAAAAPEKIVYQTPSPINEPTPPTEKPPAVPATVTPAIVPVVAPTPVTVSVPGTGSVTVPVPLPVTAATTTIQAPAIVWPERDPVKIAQAKALNAHLAGTKKYKENTGLVKNFQATEGLKQDGLWGKDAALIMAERYGIIPTKPFYWPKDTSKVAAAKSEYRAKLMALASKDPSRATEWTMAATV
jgi:hypothetical protein